MSVTITAKVKRVSAKAILIEYDGEDIWLPLSQLQLFPVLNDTGDVMMSDWIADQKGITESDDERYVAEASPGPGPANWAVKDMSINPVHIMCVCGTQRDAEIIAASLEMTKNKL